MRTKIPNINARDVATILAINPYQTAYELLEDKIENKHPFFGNKFTEHGNRYESQAIKSFEKIINKNINSNLNNMKHPEFEWLTGRLDGILEMNEETYDDTSRKRKRKETKGKERKGKGKGKAASNVTHNVSTRGAAKDIRLVKKL